MEVVICILLMAVEAVLIFWACKKHERSKTKTLGTLQIDHSDPDMPYIFLLDYDLNYIATKKQATFEVKVENIISQN